MLTVHHLENSRSHRVLWLLEELGQEYRVEQYKRDKKTSLAPAALKKIHPLGKSPIIEDRGRVIVETGAVFEYLLDVFDDGRLRPPPGTDDLLAFRYWLHAAEGSYASAMMLSLFVRRIETAPMPFFAKPIARKIAKTIRDGYLDHTLKGLFDFAEETLSRTDWLAGDEFSAADIIMSFPFEAFAARGDIAKYKNIGAFVERISARPAYQRAIKRGGPYELMR